MTQNVHKRSKKQPLNNVMSVHKFKKQVERGYQKRPQRNDIL